MKSRTAILITGLLVSLLSAQETQNFVKNGDFSDSLNYVWNFNANGAEATGKIESAGRYFIEITTPGASDNAPQLQQGNITLEKNEAYILKFTAYSNEPATIRAQLKSNETIYTDTAVGTFTLTESPKVYSVPFFVSQNTSSNVELQFNCGINRQKTRIAFNKVSLTKDTTTQIIISKPEAGESWKTGLEKKIKWITVGNLNSVTIKYTNGKSWKTITELVANDNEYTWLIPQDAVGESCRILVSSVNGKISDTSSVFSIVASQKPESSDSGNIVKNGEFSDTTDWKFEVFDGAASGKFVNGEYAIEVEEVTNSSRENSYKVKLSQSSIKLESGVMYYFSFDAYGSEEKVIYANVGESGGAYKTVFGGDTIPVNLTTEKKTYSYAFVASGEISEGPDYRVEFNCAANIGKVVIDNVKLIKSSSAECFVLKPFANTVHKVGSVMAVEWYPSDVQTVSLEYSTDNGKKWKSIADSIGNLYAYQWTIPEESSMECLLRVIDVVTDSVLGKSAVFQINNFGIPVKKGEQIINGKFALEMTGWNELTLNNGTEASVYVKDKSLKVSIDEAGDSLSDIILSQGNLTLQKGTEYFFSFDGYSAGIRKMQVLVRSMENDSVILFDSIISLPQVSDFFEWTFVPEFDVFGKVEFNFGGSSALVSLDNISINTDHVSVRKIARKSSLDLMTMKIMHTGSNITFMLNEKVDGKLNIYNLSGKLVRSLTVSSSNIIWDRKDVYGKMSARGSYIAALRADKKKMVHSFLVR